MHAWIACLDEAVNESSRVKYVYEKKRRKMRKRKNAHSDPTKTLTLLNVALLAEGKESEVDALHHLANGNSRQDLKLATRILGSARPCERQLQWQRSTTWNSSSRINSVLPVITYAENSRASRLLTTRIIKHVDYQHRRVGYQRRESLTIIISSVVSRDTNEHG